MVMVSNQKSVKKQCCGNRWNWITVAWLRGRRRIKCEACGSVFFEPKKVNARLN